MPERGSRRTAMAASAAAAAVAATVAGCGESRSPKADTGPRPATPAVPAALTLPRDPYMAVRCPKPSSIACDTAGLAVWLRRPAARLTASIAGRPIAMTVPPTVGAPRGTYFEGALHPAGFTRPGPLHIRPDKGRYYWIGSHPVDAKVRITAHYRDGTSATTRLHLGLNAGWG